MIIALTSKFVRRDGWGRVKTRAAVKIRETMWLVPSQRLKDPSTFGPPPRKIDYNGGAASPRVTTPISSGLGAPLAADEIREREVSLQREATEEQEPHKPKPPPVPFRADTTGLSTNNLPKPPVGRLEQEVPPRTSTASPSSKPKPSLPPRLPPLTELSSYSISCSSSVTD